VADNREIGGQRPDNAARLDRAAQRMTAVSHVLRAGRRSYGEGQSDRAGGRSLVLISRAGGWWDPDPTADATAPPRSMTAAAPIDWSKAIPVIQAPQGAPACGAACGVELDAWTAQMLGRVDQDFLRGTSAIGISRRCLKACWQGVKYQVAGYVTTRDGQPGPADGRGHPGGVRQRVLRPKAPAAARADHRQSSSLPGICATTPGGPGPYSIPPQRGTAT